MKAFFKWTAILFGAVVGGAFLLTIWPNLDEKTQWLIFGVPACLWIAFTMSREADRQADFRAHVLDRLRRIEERIGGNSHNY